MNETFYGGFYGFQSAPFHITPDPALLFPTETHRAALGAIEYGISAGKGFMVVTGEVGVGKTTVLRACLDALDAKRTKIIYLFSPALNTPELYSTILDEFDVVLPPTMNAADTLRILQRLLLAFHESGTQVVLAVDEAQQMPEATLESLRILSNLETHKSKLLQIILVGQPELDAVLGRHSLRQLAQRVAVRARIKPLSFRESCRYILHRTRCAGRSVSRPLFTVPALVYLAFAARGLPRTINICCDNALINGYGHGAKRITLAIVRDACRGMKLRWPMRRTVAITVTAAAVASLALLGLLVSRSALLHPVDAAGANPSQGLVDTPRPAPSTAQTAPAASALVTTHTATTTSAEESAAQQAGAGTTTASSEPRSAPDPEVAPNAASAIEAPPGASAPPAAAEPANKPQGAARKGSKWLVREGDTLYSACRVTYGSCDEKALREILARNPQIGPDAKIYKGEVLIFPRPIQATTPN